MKLQAKKFDYKWVILVSCFMMEFICLGFCSSNPGLYTSAVTSALNIPRSLYSIGTSIRYTVQVIMGLFFGSLIQKFGMKRLVGVGMFSLCISIIIRYLTTNIIHHYIGCFFWGLGITFAGGTMASTIIRRWFDKDIGKYTGIVMSANGIGGAVSAQIITPFINNGEVFGYRKAYLLSAIISLVFSCLVLFMMKEKPAANAEDAGPAKKKARGASWIGIEFSQAKKKSYFYLTFAMVFLTGISLQSVGTISIVYMQDLGFNATFIASIATVSSLVLTCAKIIMGFLYDKKGLRFTLLLCHICVLIGFLIKANLRLSTLGMVLAMVATILGTIAQPLETVMLPLISNDLFGTASYTKVLGIFYAANALGLCLGSPICDIYRDLTGGSYVSCYWFFTALMLVVLVGFQIVIRVAHKDKQRILGSLEDAAVQ